MPAIYTAAGGQALSNGADRLFRMAERKLACAAILVWL